MSVLISEQTGDWLKLTLNRPDRLNSFDDELKKELLAAVTKAAEDAAVRAVLITGAGRGFCAGEDVSGLADAEGEVSMGRVVESFYNPLIATIRGMDKPVVCAVNGVAAGAGANLALACDIVVAARSAKFIQAFSNIGLSPDAGGSWLLPRIIGDARARAAIMLGAPISAETAQQWGLIWQVAADEDLQAEAEALVTELARRPTQALANTKKLLDTSHLKSLQEQLQIEAQSQEMLGKTADHKEGLAAFFGKRAPQFTGA